MPPRPVVVLNTPAISYADLATIAPKASVLENRLYVEDGERYSSAVITAGIDLMLHLVHQCTDPYCAIAVARYLVVYLRRSGADPQLSPWMEARNHLHPAHRLQDTIASDLTKSWTLNRLAKSPAPAAATCQGCFTNTPV